MPVQDRRELILARLLEVATGIDGVVTAQRNKRLVVDAARPAIVFFDADEEAAEGNQGNGRPGTAPNLVTMTPEIFLMLGTTPEGVGSAINALRTKFLRAVLTDTELGNIVGSNGSIHYDGCATALAMSRTMDAEMGVNISFVYPFLPTEL